MALRRRVARVATARLLPAPTAAMAGPTHSRPQAQARTVRADPAARFHAEGRIQEGMALQVQGDCQLQTPLMAPSTPKVGRRLWAVMARTVAPAKGAVAAEGLGRPCLAALEAERVAV